MTRLDTCRAGETEQGHHYHQHGGRRYYVTIVRDRRVGYLLGPYHNHQEAVNNVGRGRKLACAADAWADFDSFGTASLPADVDRRTVFNN